MEDQALAVAHCRACGAVIGADADWCSLCFAPRSEPPPAVRVAPLASPPPVVVSAAPVSVPVIVARAEASWPCLTCEQPNPHDTTVCTNCGAPFLAAAASPMAVQLPVVGDLFALSKAQQIAVFAVAGVLLMALLLAVMSVLGLVL